MGRAVVAAIDAARVLRPATRVGEGFFRDGLRFRQQSLAWSDERRRDWMLQQLRTVVRRAAKETVFYRQRFQSVGFDAESPFTFDDYARLPPLEREDVMSSDGTMLSSAVSPELRRKDGTGGSTGVPLHYFTGPEERGWRESGQVFAMRRLGVSRGESMALLWGHHIDNAERTRWRDRLRDTVTNRRWYDCFRLSPEQLLSYHADMTEFRPVCLTAYASALAALAAVLVERGLTASYPTTRIVTGAEKLWPQQRAHIEQAFPVPVHEQYGGRDAGLVAMQLDPRTSLDFAVDFANAFVEPASDEQQADILVTKLHADAMPMLRYRIGDVARFPTESRTGSPTMVLHEVLGRSVDRLYLPDGRWLHGLGVPHLMKDFPLREFQLRQNVDHTVDVLVVPNEQWTEAAGERIVGVLRQNLPGLDIRLAKVAEIPRTKANKWRPVVSAITAPVA
ncbi:MAG: hypothetical protein ABIT38_01660 [Gemmatimonadaceae bacterium]